MLTVMYNANSKLKMKWWPRTKASAVPGTLYFPFLTKRSLHSNPHLNGLCMGWLGLLWSYIATGLIPWIPQTNLSDKYLGALYPFLSILLLNRVTEKGIGGKNERFTKGSLKESWCLVPPTLNSRHVHPFLASDLCTIAIFSLNKLTQGNVST